MNHVLYLFAILIAICCFMSIREGRKTAQGCLSVILPLLPPVLMRFAPALVGLEWRAGIRPSIELAAAVLLLLWCTACIAASKFKQFSILITAVFLLSICMLSDGIFFHVNESVHIRPGALSYIRENSDPGSLANVRYFRYVNEIFRGLLPLQATVIPR